MHFTLCVFFPQTICLAAIPDVIEQIQPKIVKIYGAGGLRGMENYQSGVLISPAGHILTVYSYVLDADEITVVTADGRRFPTQLLGADPQCEAAVLKIQAERLPCFDLSRAARAEAGRRILAFSNLFGVAVGDEQVSVQRGTISAVVRLEAHRGVFETPYRGPVYVLDVTTNNPGAVGGALVAFQGELLGLLGKELRNSLNNAWLNYAIPIERLRPSVDAILAGNLAARRDAESEKKPDRPLSLAMLGIAMVPDVLERTPPYVDRVRVDSPAARAGLQPDDLVVLVNRRLVQSCKMLAADLERIDEAETVQLTVQRGQELLEFTLRADGRSNPLRKAVTQ